MSIITLLISLALSSSSAFAAIGDSYQKDIDSAFVEIMQTQMGQTICRRILGADVNAIRFHLAVSQLAAENIVAGCGSKSDDPWVYPTSYQDIHKLTLMSFKPRKYVLLNADSDFPIESWTDPFTNTTVLLIGRSGISHQRLVQLLAHELAVYFDSKANPAHPDAQNIPQLRDIILQTTAPMSPLVAVSDPLIAHTLTFVRGLQVEYAIVDELILKHVIVPPADHDDPYLRYLISDQCQEACLEKLVAKMRVRYLPIGLPLLAFAPHFRALLAKDLVSAKPNWRRKQWAHLQEVLNTLPVEFLKSQFTGNPIADLQRVFLANRQPSYRTVSKFLDDSLWPLERDSLLKTRLHSGQSLLEFMKIPLLSGYNILLSSGPRVRVGTGNSE